MSIPGNFFKNCETKIELGAGENSMRNKRSLMYIYFLWNVLLQAGENSMGFAQKLWFRLAGLENGQWYLKLEPALS